MSAADDVARMLTLVPWLIERPGASLAEIATAFGVSERTIQRDLEHLDFCGMPGLGGGALFEVTFVGDRVLVAMADELRRPLRLTPREAVRLVVALTAVEQALGDELPALRSAIAKVRRVANLPGDSSVAVAAEAAGSAAAIRRALVTGRQLRLAYQGRGDESPRDRVVEPWQLDVTPDGWYLQAYDAAAGGLRSFRLDRVAAVEILDRPRERDKPREPLPPPVYQPGDDALEVELILTGGARWIAEAVTCRVDEETPAGRRIVFDTDAPGWIARMVLMAGGGVSIVRPATLGGEVIELATAALTAYQEPD